MSSGGRKRLVISEEELTVPQPPPPSGPSLWSGSQPQAPAEPAPSFPPVQGAPPRRVDVPGSPVAGAPTPALLIFARSVRGRNTIAATCGVLLGWAICEITHFGLWSATSSLGLDMTTGAYTAMVGLCFAFVYTGWEQILARNWEGMRDVFLRTAPVALPVAFAAGFIADALYIHFIEQILRGLTLSGLLHVKSNLKIYLVRALAWGLFGAGMGYAVGRGQSREKIINGIAGGAVGGAIGGLFFNYLAFHISSASLGRLLSLVVVGLCIGLAVGIVEMLRREAWLHISGGPMAGKEFIVYGSQFTLGASPKCDMTIIKDQTVLPHHAAIATVAEGGGQARYLSPYEGASVSINGAPTGQHHRLRTGDLIGIGATVIAYSEHVAPS